MVYGIIAASGVVLAAVYMLWMFQRVVWGEVKDERNRNLPDLSLREWFIMTPLVVLMFWIGLYPGAFLKKTELSAKLVIEQVRIRQIESLNELFATVRKDEQIR